MLLKRNANVSIHFYNDFGYLLDFMQKNFCCNVSFRQIPQ